jgi:hypothetical protein
MKKGCKGKSGWEMRFLALFSDVAQTVVNYDLPARQCLGRERDARRVPVFVQRTWGENQALEAMKHWKGKRVFNSLWIAQLFQAAAWISQIGMQL